ncbi:MAG TPA: acyl-CoA carboxylase epsilon subunit [Marmoricola sp.]|nr:acyl-CoA carboxylase epsilon subunit [Marmoricola sp.]
MSGREAPATQRDGAERSEPGAERSGASGSDRSASQAPELKIVNPDATPEEIAAVVAVFAALQSPAPAPEKPRSLWAARQRRTRAALRPGPGAWRASALPR